MNDDQGTLAISAGVFVVSRDSLVDRGATPFRPGADVVSRLKLAPYFNLTLTVVGEVEVK
jgi:hypothetical protein